jgi:hypothetical protein
MVQAPSCIYADTGYPSFNWDHNCKQHRHEEWCVFPQTMECKKDAKITKEAECSCDFSQDDNRNAVAPTRKRDRVTHVAAHRTPKEQG